MRKAVALFQLLVVACAVLTVPAIAGDQRVRGARARIHRVAPPPPDYDDGYFTNYVTGPTGQPTPVMQVPGSTSVITRKMMDDFQSRNLCDALRLAPGVTTSGC
ncbi:MAG: TonB-dependent receptor plug domain-containing protein [Methylocystis sp.]|uniref:TonB-dependent receptor plug domain-containing protein n=1 Tax=Methylocystis sp. TaxID=1911079 RepID=UPI003D101F73